MSHLGRSVALAGALLVLTACGGGEPESKPTPTKATTQAEKPEKTEKSKEPEKAKTPTADFDGTPVPEALSRFQCVEEKKSWTATGYVANSGKKAASFQVTVHVGTVDGEPQAARTMRLSNVEAGGSVSFEITKVPSQGEGPCHVQVLLLE